MNNLANIGLGIFFISSKDLLVSNSNTCTISRESQCVGLVGRQKGKNAIPGTPEVNADFAKLANPNLTSIDQAPIIADFLFPHDWKEDHPNYLSYLPQPQEPISPKTVQLQGQAVANRKGSSNRLANITKPTLVIGGTEDAVTPPANSIILAQKIPGAWLVQINGGGHGLMYQYPKQYSNVL
jgi:pimeloyl-ACP methyl ester carboxylesterase